MASALEGLVWDFSGLLLGLCIVFVVEVAFGLQDLVWLLLATDVGFLRGLFFTWTITLPAGVVCCCLELWSCGVGVGTAALLPPSFSCFQVLP